MQHNKAADLSRVACCPTVETKKIHWDKTSFKSTKKLKPIVAPWRADTTPGRKPTMMTRAEPSDGGAIEN
jgi:hypothetical protein